ncbi:MAG: sulfite exporter TauE/SafE family protein [Patescibacteria group bacterium]
MNLKIKGMHCPSCEVLIERRFKKADGVDKVEVSAKTGACKLYYTKIPDITSLGRLISDAGYTVVEGVSHKSEPRASVASHFFDKFFSADFVETLTIAFLVFVLYLAFNSLGFELFPSSINENMSYISVFLLGLFAATSSCMAVSGGLILALSTSYSEKLAAKGQEIKGVYSKMKLPFMFNVGRVVSYTFFGAVIGLVGSFLAGVSSQIATFLMILAGIIMLITALELLGLLPDGFLRLPLIKKFSNFSQDLAEKNERLAAPLLGASTFFLPCGFTQALQLYVLGRGNAVEGAFIMFLFSLGTAPALLTVGALSSFLQGAFKRYFLKFSGVIVLILGIITLRGGLSLSGVNFPLSLPSIESNTKSTVRADNYTPARLENGKQIIDMRVVGYSYFPNKFKVAKGVPVEWRIDASKAKGCAQVLTVPKLKITQYLSSASQNKIEFTPSTEGKIAFSCTMGMTTPGSEFEVVSSL